MRFNWRAWDRGKTTLELAGSQGKYSVKGTFELQTQSCQKPGTSSLLPANRRSVTSWSSVYLSSFLCWVSFSSLTTDLHGVLISSVSNRLACWCSHFQAFHPQTHQVLAHGPHVLKFQHMAAMLQGHLSTEKHLRHGSLWGASPYRCSLLS